MTIRKLSEMRPTMLKGKVKKLRQERDKWKRAFEKEHAAHHRLELEFETIRRLLRIPESCACDRRQGDDE